MKGDFTRFTFQPQKHYTSVRMQQGRLQLDSDWNEQVDIQNHLRHTQTVDTIGADSGVPTSEGDSENPYRDSFKISVIGDGNDLAIDPGHLYVNGTLCELERLVTYKTQPDYPNPTDGQQLTEGIYLAYIDVWQRHITTIEDPNIREVALNIPDTTTRTKTIWQLKLKKLDELIEEIGEPETKNILKTFETNKNLNNLNDYRWKSLIDQVWKLFLDRQKNRQQQAKLNACAKYCSSSSNSAATGIAYQRLENQLYRVEIHNSGTVGDRTQKKNNTKEIPTFKWSRDNGSTFSAIEGLQNNTIIIRKSSPDAWSSYKTGQWIEITDEEMELKGKPGVLAPLLKVSDTKIEFDNSRIVNGPIPQHPTKVRRWDHTTQEAAIVTQSEWIPLEAGIKVKFEPNSSYETGDYWLIPARSATNDIEWPNDQAKPIPQPLPQFPQGIQHNYCSLALVTVNNQGKFEQDKAKQGESEPKNLRDLRVIFPPLMRCLDTAGGVISGTLEIQSDLYVTGRYQKQVNRYVDGKVGIGTKEPLAKLHIQSAKPISGQEQIPIARLENSEGNPQFVVLANGNTGIGTPHPYNQLDVFGGVAIGQAYAGKTKAPNNGLLIEGNVGFGLAKVQNIGIQPPLSRLHIQAAGFIDGKGTIDSITNSKELTFSGSDLSNQLHPGDLLKLDEIECIITEINGNSLTIYPPASALKFPTSFWYQQPIARLENSEGNPQFVVLGNGNTGIGTPHPYNQLDVVGGVAIGQAYAGKEKAPDNGLLVDGTVIIGSPLPSNTENFKLYVNGDIKGNSITANSGIFRSSQGVNLYFQTGDTTQISVAQNSGNVGIGIEPDADAKLHVGGLVKLTNNQQSATVSFTNDNWLRFSSDNLDGYFFNKRIKVEVEQGAIALGLTQNNGSDFLSALKLTRKLENNNSQSINCGFQNKNFVLLSNDQNRFAIAYETGNIGIGTPNPAQKLHINGGIVRISQGEENTEQYLEIGKQNSSQCEFNTTYSQYYFNKPIIISDRLELKAGDQSSATISYENGSVKIGGGIPSNNVQDNLNLYVNGKLYIKQINVESSIANTVKSAEVNSDSFHQNSSMTLKKDIQDLSSQEVTAILKSLNPVKFIYTEDESKTPHAGFIAEDTPDLLTTNDKQAIKVVDIVAVLTKVAQDNRKTLSDLVKVVKKQQAEIAMLTQKIKKLEERTEQ